MSAKVTVTAEQCFDIVNKIEIFFSRYANQGLVEGLDGGLAWDIKDIQRIAKQKTDTSTEYEQELKKTYPFEYKNLGTKEAPAISRAFDGSSADEKATAKTKVSRGELDSVAFYEKWNKAMEKETTLSDLPKIGREEMSKVSGQGINLIIDVIQMLN